MNQQSSFLSLTEAQAIRKKFGTPVYVYDLETLREQAKTVLAFPHAYGLTVRYALKANPNSTFLRLFDKWGLHLDAGSEYEVLRALQAGIEGKKISLSTQQFPTQMKWLHKQGIHFNASSLHQIKQFGQILPGASLGLRFNPGIGSGAVAKTDVGGSHSSFGIWHEALTQAKEQTEQYGLKVIRIHTHIGSGTDPILWQQTAKISLQLLRHFPCATTLNLGGGFAVARMPTEKTSKLQEMGTAIKTDFEALAVHGLKIHLEIEPGTYLIANAGVLLTTVQDIVSTGKTGYTFLKIDAGMTEILRPALYGARHPLVLLSPSSKKETQFYVVVGHCCESGDLLTPAPGTPDILEPREMPVASIGDLCVIKGTGAYCAAMSAIHYNSFPQAPEVLIDDKRSFHLIRKRETLDQIVQNEQFFGEE